MIYGLRSLPDQIVTEIYSALRQEIVQASYNERYVHIAPELLEMLLDALECGAPQHRGKDAKNAGFYIKVSSD